MAHGSDLQLGSWGTGCGFKVASGTCSEEDAGDLDGPREQKCLGPPLDV